MPPSPIASATLFARVLPALLIALLSAGCDDAPETNSPAPIPQAQVAPAYEKIKWLDLHTNVTPEQWLASRSANAELPIDSPEVAEMRASLAKAARLFVEDPRMIANRAVQLEEMLSAEGISESATEIIEILVPFGSETGTRHVFGAVGEHYFNLRRQGLDRKAAVERLEQEVSNAPGSRPNHG